MITEWFRRKAAGRSPYRDCIARLYKQAGVETLEQAAARASGSPAGEDDFGPLVYCRETGSAVNYPCANSCEMGCHPLAQVTYVGASLYRGRLIEVGDKLLYDKSTGSLGTSTGDEHEVVEVQRRAAGPYAVLMPVADVPVQDEDLLVVLQGMQRVMKDTEE